MEKSRKKVKFLKSGTDQTVKVEYLHKVDSECELNSWPDSSVG